MHFEVKEFKDLSLEELYSILALRQEIFIVEQDCPYLDADGKDQGAHHVLATSDDGILQAYTRLLSKGISYPEHCSIGRVICRKSHRQTGLGKQIMQHSIKSCQDLFHGQLIKISAQVYLDRFYQSLGFNPIGEGYLEDDIPHQAMIYQPNVL